MEIKLPKAKTETSWKIICQRQIQYLLVQLSFFVEKNLLDVYVCCLSYWLGNRFAAMERSYEIHDNELLTLK